MTDLIEAATLTEEEIILFDPNLEWTSDGLATTARDKALWAVAQRAEDHHYVTFAHDIRMYG